MRRKKSFAAIAFLAAMALMVTLSCSDDDSPVTPTNHAPVIESVELSLDGTVIPEDDYDNIPGGRVIVMECTVSDPDNDSLDVFWSADVGVLISTVGESAQWTPPDASGSAMVIVSVTDGLLGSADTLILGTVQNTLPVIDRTWIWPVDVDEELPESMWDIIPTGTVLSLLIEVSDADDDELTLTWHPPVDRTITLGQPIGWSILWATPDTASTIDIIIEADDGVGSVADTMPIHAIPYYGGEAADYGYAVVATPDGGYAIAGHTNSMGAGGPDGLLIKTDAKGNLQWQKTYGGSAGDYFNALIATDDGGFAMAGQTFSSVLQGSQTWVVKTDGNGVVEWDKTYGGDEIEQAFGLTEVSAGGFAAVGSSDSYSSGDEDCYIVRIDTDGDILWWFTVGGVYDDVAKCVVETDDGGFVFAGEREAAATTYGYVVRVDDEGSYMWDQYYGGSSPDDFRSVIAYTDDTFVLAGATESAGGGGTEVWLVKIDGDNDVIWDVTLGGTGDEYANALVPTLDGGFAIAGGLTAPGEAAQALYIRTNGTGQLAGYNTLGGFEPDVAFGLCATAAGNFAMTGYTQSFDADLVDIFLFRVDGNGRIVD